MKTDVFIVRIWKEPREARDVPEVWRGTVEHVSSKAVRHIRQWSELIEFVKAMAGIAEDEHDTSEIEARPKR